MRLVAVLFVAASFPGVFAKAPGSESGLYIDTAETAALAAYWKIEPSETLDGLAGRALVERQSRELFAFDTAIHAGARAEAVHLRRQLISGELSPWAEAPSRHVFELTRRLSEGPGAVLALLEEREGFVLNVVLSETVSGTLIARYVVPKLTFDAWRERAPAGPSSQPELFGFCAEEGRAIVLTLDADAPSTALLLDATGEPLATGGQALPAPYTGVYHAQVSRDASATRDDFLLSIGVGGRENAEARADLSVTASHSPEPVEAGALLMYSVVIYNAGPDAALDAEMIALPPATTTFQAITGPIAQGSWSCTVPAVGRKGKVSCTTKCFAPGTSAAFTITVRVDPCLGSANLVGTMASSSTTVDPNLANDTATEPAAVSDPGTCDDANVCTSGDQCGPGLSFQAEFDEVSVPFIPSEWTTTLVTGPPGARPWRTVGNDFVTAPNSIFTPDASEIRDSVLDSPGIPIVSSAAQLRFRNRYNLEKDNDGGVLEIKIGNGEFQDILLAGGNFAEGGYNGRISQSFGSPIAGRHAWTNVSPGFVPTTVNLPSAAAGNTIVLRFRMATDRSLGLVGQWIDSVAVTGRDVCRPGASIVCDDADACTSDSCDAVLGCRHAVLSCDDGDACNGLEACLPAIGCVTGPPLGCSDGDACNGVETCNASSGCVFGIPVDCAVPGPCREAGICQAASGLCLYPPKANGIICDDASVCTVGDICLEGACRGGVITCVDDGDACTVDVCHPADGCHKTSNMDQTPGSFSENRVDGLDLVVLANAWNRCDPQPGYSALADLDPLLTPSGLTCVDDADFHRFMDAFGRDCAP